MQSNQVHNRIISSSNMFSLIKSSPLGVCITDEQGKFIFVNNAYCALYGYQADELIGQDFTIIVPQQARDELMALHHAFIHSSLEDSEQVLTELRSEWTVIDRQGNPLTIIANAVLLVGKDGARSKATFVTDITQQKNAEEKLLRANRQLAYHASRDELTGLLNRRPGWNVYRGKSRWEEHNQNRSAWPFWMSTISRKSTIRMAIGSAMKSCVKSRD